MEKIYKVQKNIVVTIAKRLKASFNIVGFSCRMDKGAKFFSVPHCLLWVDLILSPFAKYPERKLADGCEDVLLRRDSAPDEALGEDTPTVRSWGASCVFFF